MSLVEFISTVLSVFFCAISLCICYKLLSSKKNRILNIKNFLFLIFIGILEILISLSQYTINKTLINFVIVYSMLIIIYKENYKLTFIKTLLIIIVQTIIEFIYSFPMFLLVDNVKDFDNLIIIKNLTSILIFLNLILMFYIKPINKFLRNIIKNIIEKKTKILEIILIIMYGTISFFLIRYMFNITANNYISNNIIIIYILLVVIFLIITQNKYLRSEEKQKSLLEFITKYEILIDKNRINRHEMLNNLIILSTYKDKNSKNFNDTLNEMIENYSIEKNKTYRNIGKLSIGIKGVFYYKISDIEVNNIDFEFHCTPKANEYLKNTNIKDYNKCCKLLGIFMDNAIDAAKESVKKKIIVDIYIKERNMIFYIENSTTTFINMKKLKDKNYSSKGKGRGLGLYIANKLKIQSKQLDYIQYLNSANNFVTELYIKIK